MDTIQCRSQGTQQLEKILKKILATALALILPITGHSETKFPTASDSIRESRSTSLSGIDGINTNPKLSACYNVLRDIAIAQVIRTHAIGRLHQSTTIDLSYPSCMESSEQKTFMAEKLLIELERLGYKTNYTSAQHVKTMISITSITINW